MPLQATSGAASYDAFGGGVPAVPKYIEDYFSTYLVTGDGTAPAVNNGIDLSTKGGLVWIKKRSAAGSHSLFDTARGANLRLISNDTAAQDSVNLSFTTTGFSNYTLDSGVTYASWSWAKAPKFFDVVTYTGNGTSKTITHNLGSTPACIITKRLNSTSNWLVYHRSIPTQRIYLNQDGAASGTIGVTSVGSTSYDVNSSSELNENNGTYVAYIFAHDAGGFGLTGTDNVISCGSWTGTGSNLAVNLGYEPQWLMFKRTDDVGDWVIVDNMRGFTTTGADAYLKPNTSGAETSVTGAPAVDATGFNWTTGSGATFIYIAIRRGPMKVPTVGTTVFAPVAQTNTGSRPFPVTAGFPVDLGIFAQRAGWLLNSTFNDRLRGPTNILLSTTTGSETFNNSTYGPSTSRLDSNTQFFAGGPNASEPVIYWMMRRAPSFFDEVCYTSATHPMTVNHNLNAVPELIIVKPRNSTSYGWITTSAGLTDPDKQYVRLNLTDAQSTAGASNVIYNRTTTTFTLGAVLDLGAGEKWVAYLFATCAGVSKVGSYTGTATTKQIDCGFTAGARFVLIKRIDSTGDWYVWDSVRGIVSGNDPYLLLNTTDAEVTNTDYIDTYSAGFEISSTAPSAINASGGTFIFLAIA